MSTYVKNTKHPVKDTWEEATWHDDLFGSHHYGVVFPSDATELEKHVGTELWGIEARKVAFDPRKIELETDPN